MNISMCDPQSIVAASRPRSPCILLVIPTLSAGGAERVMATLANHWVAAGYTIGIATFESPSANPYYALDERVRLQPLDLPPLSRPLWRGITQTFRRIAALRRTIKLFEPDIVISFLTKTNVMAVAAARGLGVPVIISERNNPRLQNFGLFWNVARALTFPYAFSMVAMTQGALDFYPERERSRARIIPNPVSLPANLSFQRTGRTLTAVGRLNRQKRFDRLIDAFSMIAGDFPDWKLVIWGEGGERPALEGQIERLGLNEQVALPGLTTAPGRWVETADLFVLTSEYEGWANVIVEAMAAGLAVVSVDCEYGPKELLLSDNSGMCRGVVVPKDNLKALAEALAGLMRDPDARELLGRHAAEYARRFTPEAVAAQWDALIAEAVDQR